MRRVRQAPAPPGVPPLPPPAAAAAATTQQPQAPPRPPPPPFPESDDDDDASLFAVEPEVLPVDPADLAAALEDMASGNGADIGVFGDGGGGGWGEDGEWEAPPPLGDPGLLLVQAESSLVGGSGGDAALEPAPGVAEPNYADPDAALAGLSGRERDARTDLLLSLATAGADFEAALARAGPDLLDGACLRLLERRIRALKMCEGEMRGGRWRGERGSLHPSHPSCPKPCRPLIFSLPPLLSLSSTATSPTDKAGLHTLNLLLARLTAEVARRQATPVERAMDVALRLLARPAVEGAASTGYLPQPSPSSPPPGATSDPGAPARIAAARAFLATVVDRVPGRGRGGPDRLATEVAAALAARTGGGASAGAAATDPLAPPDLPPVWEEALLPAATLIEEAGVLVAAASTQVEELRAATRR